MKKKVITVLLAFSMVVSHAAYADVYAESTAGKPDAVIEKLAAVTPEGSSTVTPEGPSVVTPEGPSVVTPEDPPAVTPEKPDIEPPVITVHPAGTELIAGTDKYKVTAESTETTYTGTTAAGVITIPDTVTIDGITYRVTSIADGAFKDRTDITSVTIGHEYCIDWNRGVL